MFSSRTLLLGGLVWFAAASAGARAGESRLVEEALMAGPFAASPALRASEPGALKVEFVPEIDPLSAWPAAGQQFLAGPGARGEWRPVQGAGGEWSTGKSAPGRMPGRIVEWVACYVRVDRFGPMTVRVHGAGELRLFQDGAAAGHSGSPEDAETRLEHTSKWPAGQHRLLLRIERVEAAPLKIECAAGADQRLSIDIDPRHAVTDYDELREIVSLTGLELSPDGSLLAFQRREWDPGDSSSWSRLEVLDVDQRTVRAASLGGSGSRALSWNEAGDRLLLQNGRQLFIWSANDGSVERILADEPGLGAVSWSRDGELIVFSSTRGVKPAESGNRRRVELREKLSDWPREPHLHLLMVSSGVRLRLSVPGDYLQDAFELLPDSRRLLYLVNRPAERRPWFQTEFRLLDLETGEDRLVSTLQMGFENRPGMSGLAVSPDGRKAAFVGPPSELGEKAEVEPNAFDPNLFVIDLESGATRRLTADLLGSVDGHLHWSADSRRLDFLATVGSESRLIGIALEPEGEAERIELEVGAEVAHDLSQAGDLRICAVASAPGRLPALYLKRGAEQPAELLLDPNAELEARLRLFLPEDVSYTGPDGSPIEAWLYRPEAPPEERLPLIVYYYGGAMPTKRSFNELHQFLVGHGYALLVMNPRGATGYGQPFADQHVGEWGQRAGADIIEGVRKTLAAHPELDPERVGCYGGSYGGFMTLWLISHCDLFHAAVSLYGISNIASYFGDGTWGYTYGDQAINRYPWEDPEWFAEHSPLYQADRIHTPLLLLHGEADTNVPISESEQIFTALRLLDRPVELVRFPGEDHGLRGKWENRAAHREMLLEWFDRSLRDRPAAWEARWN